jgi:putative transcriptional regulator
MESLLDIGWPVKHAFHMRSRLRELREGAGLSQAELGAAVGVSRQTINAIERGRYLPSLPLAFQLSRFFDMLIEEVFDAEQ